MDLLEHPDAQPLLHDADLHSQDVRSCAEHLEPFMARYLPRFLRREHREHAHTILQGKLTGLPRKTTEPIATQAGLKRRPLQLFVGAGGWDDRAVLSELHRHVDEAIGHADGVYILDGCGFPKKGTASCGVARQWCGRLGKVDNCQVGVFLAYASPTGKALLDARLYRPQEWADDGGRREQTGVPAEVVFAEKWRLGLSLLDGARHRVDGGWVVGDDEFGRCSDLRGQLRLRQLRYVLDVPCNTLVRDVAERRPATQPGGRQRKPLFERVDHWVARQRAGRWRTVQIRDGEKGPLTAKVLLASVQTKDEAGRVGALERLVVIKTCEKKPRTWYALSNDREARRAELARVHGTRHRVEELLQEGNQEVGLSHYEVRSWTGWHHHLTLTLLALWFLQLERLRLGGKNTGGHGATSAGDLHGAAARAGGQRRTNRGEGERSAAA